MSKAIPKPAQKNTLDDDKRHGLQQMKGEKNVQEIMCHLYSRSKSDGMIHSMSYSVFWRFLVRV